MNKLSFIGIIPARYASSRFPGKPLAMIGDKPMIQRVYEQAKKVLADVYVATDDSRIYDAVESFGGKAVMTGSHHRSGTDRCAEALERVGGHADVVVNVQGDEPFIDVTQLTAIKECFETDEQTQIATLVKPFDPTADSWATLSNPNSPKVVIDNHSNALYFSRSVIPYFRGEAPEQWLNKHTYYKHIGLYAYRADVLRAITRLSPSPLEVAESLEQLRWLSAGYTIKVRQTNVETVGIDTPDDLLRAEQYLKSHA